jgi:3-oxoacyl-[acyl-carrier protein] reductase
MDLKNKAALVTGASVGTGRAVAIELARRGCDVVVNYSRSQSEAEETAGEIRALGVRAIAVQADVADDAAVRSMVERTRGEFGRLDVLVNNAAVTSFIAHGDLEGVKDEDWDRILGVNLKGPFQAVRAAAPALKESRGVVVNVSSVAGVAGIGSSIPYCASKAALNIMTVALARALAPEIRVNAVAPGFIDTRWWKDRDGYEVVKHFATERAPLKRICQPEDVAAVVLGLIDAELVTGQVVVVDGGMTLAS